MNVIERPREGGGDARRAKEKKCERESGGGQTDDRERQRHTMRDKERDTRRTTEEI